jgi:UDP-N-acetylglucosamine 2-epimerase
MKRILVFAGTRPEAIKLAPVIRALRETEGIETRLCATGQHRQMLAQAFADFGLAPDVDLGVMTAGQTLAGLSARLFTGIDALLEQEAPDAVLVQGDTTTVQVAALSAFYRRIPVGYIEAGLRSGDITSPFPEELNRRIATLAAAWHFAPTPLARDHLLAEGVAADAVFVTGNTVVDALMQTLAAMGQAPAPLPDRLEAMLGAGRRFVLMTGHRRESFGDGFQRICDAVEALARRYPDVAFVYPVHLNPQVLGPVTQRLGGLSNVFLEEPLAYRGFVRLMAGCRLILTDSGGIQEEGPSLGKPVLIMRSVTERPEGVEAGVNRLVGANAQAIAAEVSRLLDDDRAYAAMAGARNPYGDGEAARRIAALMHRLLGAPGAAPPQAEPFT